VLFRSTSTGDTVRGFRAIRVLRCRILKVPNPRTSMFFWFCSASLMASRKESTTRAQSFFEIIGPAVREICSVTLSTRSALVMNVPRVSAPFSRERLPNLPPLTLVCQEFESLRAGLANHIEKLIEQWAAVMRTGCGLGVILHGKDRQLPMPKPLHRAVVEIHVGYL